MKRILFACTLAVMLLGAQFAFADGVASCGFSGPNTQQCIFVTPNPNVGVPLSTSSLFGADWTVGYVAIYQNDGVTLNNQLVFADSGTGFADMATLYSRPDLIDVSGLTLLGSLTLGPDGTFAPVSITLLEGIIPIYPDTFVIFANTPEPASLLLLGSGLGLIVRKLRQSAG